MKVIPIRMELSILMLLLLGKNCLINYTLKEKLRKKVWNQTTITILTRLKHLYCSNNQLPKLDVSSNKELISLYCFDNQLMSLDCSGLGELEELNCSRNYNKKIKNNLTNLIDLSLKLNGSFNLDHYLILELNSPKLEFLDTSRSNIKDIKFIQPSPLIHLNLVKYYLIRYEQSINIFAVKEVLFGQVDREVLEKSVEVWKFAFNTEFWIN
jgi:hypothetical protein